MSRKGNSRMNLEENILTKTHYKFSENICIFQKYIKYLKFNENFEINYYLI